MRTILIAALVVLSSVVLSGQSYSYTVQNNSSHTIRELYMSPSSDSSWGRDRLGRSMLEPGQRHTVRGLSYGRWDLKLVDTNYDECIVNRMLIDRSRTEGFDSAWLLRCEGY
ncbi:MAG: hypothetical protein QF786_00145 [Vicinamibacterales bacterium]|jgi:hypothetical protein|nr:hypothetical protein [Vicinamibacterales bacterium]